MNWVAALRGVAGNKVGMAIAELHQSERDLAGALRRTADSQQAEHEIAHVAGDLARWSDLHVRGLARTGRHYGLELGPESQRELTVVSRARQLGSMALGRFSEPGLLLLGELRHLHRLAAGVSLDWEILAQTAQAVKDGELLDLAQACHPETLRQMRWANAKLKELSPQVMTTH